MWRGRWNIRTLSSCEAQLNYKILNRWSGGCIWLHVWTQSWRFGEVAKLVGAAINEKCCSFMFSSKDQLLIISAEHSNFWPQSPWAVEARRAKQPKCLSMDDYHSAPHKMTLDKEPSSLLLVLVNLNSLVELGIAARWTANWLLIFCFHLVLFLSSGCEMVKQLIMSDVTRSWINCLIIFHSHRQRRSETLSFPFFFGNSKTQRALIPSSSSSS